MNRTFIEPNMDYHACLLALLKNKNEQADPGKIKSREYTTRTTRGTEKQSSIHHPNKLQSSVLTTTNTYGDEKHTAPHFWL